MNTTHSAASQRAALMERIRCLGGLPQEFSADKEERCLALQLQEMRLAKALSQEDEAELAGLSSTHSAAFQRAALEAQVRKVARVQKSIRKSDKHCLLDSIRNLGRLPKERSKDINERTLAVKLRRTKNTLTLEEAAVVDAMRASDSRAAQAIDLLERLSKCGKLPQAESPKKDASCDSVLTEPKR